jgi:hypothetical protein
MEGPVGNIRKFRKEVTKNEEDLARERAKAEWDATFDIDPAVAMKQSSLLWWCWLHPWEWRVLLALSGAKVAFAELDEGLTVQASFIEVMKELHCDYGYEFYGLKLTPDDDLFVKTQKPTCAANALWIRAMELNIIDYLEHTLFAQKWLEKFIPAYDLTQLKAFEQDTREELEKSRNTPFTDEQKQQMAEIAAARKAFFEQYPHLKPEEL